MVYFRTAAVPTVRGIYFHSSPGYLYLQFNRQPDIGNDKISIELNWQILSLVGSIFCIVLYPWLVLHQREIYFITGVNLQ